MRRSPEWGNVVLGVDVLQGHGEQSQPGVEQYNKEHPRAKGKQQYNPGRNQELNLPADIFPMHAGSRENPNAPSGKVVPYPGVHERIKEREQARDENKPLLFQKQSGDLPAAPQDKPEAKCNK